MRRTRRNPAPVTQTEAFRRWFGDSKVVDERGEPLVVYHGTPDARGLFGADGSGKRGFRTSPTRGTVFFATDDQRTASSYANPHRAWDYQNAEPAVIPLYLSIQNPLVVDGKFQHWRGTEAMVEKARADGHDGAIILNTIDHYATPSKKPRREDASTVYVFFSPTQAKSAMPAPVVARDLNNWYMPDRSGRTLDFTGPNDGTFDVDDPDLRSNPIPARDPTFSLDPYEWVAGTVLEDYCDEDDAGFFHVTTRGAKVFEEGRLRSRSDVGVIGLGGGRIDPGKHVSVVVNYSRARWLYDAIKNLSRTCKRGTAVDVVKLVLDWTGFPHDNWSLAFDDDPEEGATWPVDLLEFIYEIGMTNVGGEGDYGRHDLTSRKGWDALLAEEGAEVNKKWNTPGKRYKLAQFMEDRLESTFYHEDWWDGGICVPLVGFTAAPAEFLRIDPDDVTIVQVALRETVGLVEEIPRECELRLPPADIQIVAVGCEDARNRLPVLPRDG